jgi:hypothetical protein
MNMKKQLTQGILAASLSFLVWSCNQSDPAPKGDYVDGVFVTTIGNFFDNNGSLSFFKRENRTADIDVYATVNGSALQGGIQDYAYMEGKGILTVDNSSAGLDKVEIVDANTFEKIASIGAPDIENPRKVAFATASKAYVSCWGTNGDYTYSTGYIAVIDLSTNKVIKKINIAKGPEKLLLHAGKLYVGTTDYTNGKTLTVIDTNTDEIVKTVEFEGAPAPIGIDANGRLWVGAGRGISKVSLDSYAKGTLNAGNDVSKLLANMTFSLDKKTIFFMLTSDFGTKGQVYKVGIDDSVIDMSKPFINRFFTGLDVDPKQGLIYAAVDPDPVQSGYAVRYRTDGSVVDSIKVGASPIGFVFR